MKIKPHSKRQHRYRVEHLVKTFGSSFDHKAYQSIMNNIIGLTRKIQGLNKKLKNEKELNDVLSSRLAEQTKLAAFGGCEMGVGDGTGNLFVRGSYESIKAAQTIIIRDSDNRVASCKMANHIASSKESLPAEWQEWASEIEEDLRRMAGGS